MAQRELILRTKRLKLETWIFADSDIDELHDLHGDPRVQVSYAPGPEKWTREGIAKRLSDYCEEQDRFGLTKWRVTIDDGTFVGRAGWSPWGRNRLGIGYAFKPAFWGMGLATEAAEALMEWAGRNRSDEKLVGFALIDNHASQHILRKLGMSFVDVRDIGGVPNAYFEALTKQA